MSQNFSELGLSAGLVKGLEKAGFNVPTPIQIKAIPPQLEGRDILGIAQTGSGKTAAFVLPILAGIAKLEGRREPRTTHALILAPTRELAVQIEEVIRSLAGSMRVSTVLVLGGVSRHAQVTKLAGGVDVVIATPGRLTDLMSDRKIRLDHTKWLVLDEADRMLDMGFIKPVRQIAAAMSMKRQTALFSATMAPEVAELAKSLLKDPVRVEAALPATTVTTIEQRVILSPAKGKRQVLNDLLASADLARVLVFARTKHGADRVAKNLEIDGHKVAAIHGNKSQNARQAALKGFADGRVRLLVATDIASRGIDVSGISHVVNFELPDDAENYVHRIGRTGRNGASGIAITLCDSGELDKLRDVERLIRQKLPREGDLHLNAGGQPASTDDSAPPRRRGDAPRPQQPRRSGPPAKSAGRPPRQTARTDAGAKRAARPQRARSEDNGGRQETPAWLVNGATPPKPAPGRGKARWNRSQKASRPNASGDRRASV
ncbi:MAG: DEAD/DEAH box helicase [Devosia sp.]|nr:DEAD/DEAH box helicase [Devosia sp.]